MKLNLLLCAIALMAFISCNQSAKKEGDTHTHEDGTVHSGHCADTTKPAQESFVVANDSTSTDSVKCKDHDHDHGHSHDHGDGKTHKH